jgi:hypothetical protein
VVSASLAPPSTPAVTGRSRSWLGITLLVVAGAVLFLPALRAPFFLDDYMQASMVDGTFPAARFGAFDLYDFVNDGDRALLSERGVLPWWSEPSLVIRFFRPLSSVLLWADHRVFGASPLPLHIHSFLWWIASVLAVRALYRCLLAPRVALIATIIFALAPCHVFPIAWLANREALVSIAFGIPALFVYLRWREARRFRDASLTTLLFALSMAGGEYAICFGGYVVAIELVTRGERLARRGLGLLPFVVPTAVYLVARALLGYGAHGSGYYADPVLEPVQFAHAVPRRAAVLLAEAWGGLHGRVFDDDTPPWKLALVVAFGVGVLLWPLRRMLGRLDEGPRRTATWLLLGAHLALIPVLAAAPAPRLLGATLVGLAAAVAILLDQAWFPVVLEERRGAAEFSGLVALGLGFAHFIHGPATSWLMSSEFWDSATHAANRTATLGARRPEIARSEVIVLRGMFNSFILPFSLDERGQASGGWRILSQTGHVLALRRDARTIDLVVPFDKCLFPKGVANLFRADSSPIPVGATFRIPDARVTVLDVGPLGPRSARFEFDGDLESNRRVWINDDVEGLEDAALPRAGFGKPFDP